MPKKTPKKPMTMKAWEASKIDAAMDKSGKHGKEGSAKDMAADRKGLAAYNKKGKK